ncbi:TonB-dependent receptor [uncultured Bacteroides sp.]|uniref:SusC/RagA family TonB-linked outer membrane protein n=1 Tax=uncultured Bacteroides sp. TaxID=162156 RepID=UPI002AA888D8|nr:TonB-dependent receptor [uncultured Bacteroides sp.]
MKQVNLRICRTILPLLLGLFLSMGAFAQQVSVMGHVKDATGEPVIGANIIVKGTTNGTITDLDGNFSLQVPQNSTIVISFVGYKSVEVPATRNMTVTLQDDAVLLQEAVVIGYGTVKKSDATGSVTAIKPDKLNRGMTTNAQDMMTGKIAGVNVTSNGGTPGQGATIRVRGGSSLSASNDPLIVVDGMALDNDGIKGMSNQLSTINPNDIESFTILKDASATAIYGSRASNGVIIITTKKGTAGSRPSISYDGNVSMGVKRNTVDVLNASEFSALVAQKYGEGSDAVNALGTADTDWQNEIYRSAISTDHNLTVSGGFKNLPYRVTVGYTNQNGILKTSNFERYTGSVNLSPTFFDGHLKMNLNAKGMIANNRFADTDAVGAAVMFDPTQSVYGTPSPIVPSDENYYGGYFQWTGKDGVWNNLATNNPVALLELKHDTSNAKDFIGNAEFDYKFFSIPDLKAHLNLGMNISKGHQDLYEPIEFAAESHHGRTGTDSQFKYNKSLNFYLQYAKDLGVHHFDVMAGYEWQHFYRSGHSNYVGLVDDYNPTSSVSKTESYLVSFFGRANYSLLDRYLFTFTLRDDGTSRFSSNNRWGLFPSAALGWKINEEAFLKDVRAISNLKLRLGWGITGQQDIQQGDYSYIPKYIINTDGAYYPLGGGTGITYRPDGVNENLKWEKTATYNVGLDFGFLNGRISGSLDGYYRKTTDLLNKIDVPAGTNFVNRLYSNIGSLENKGVEFALTGRIIEQKDLSWEVNYNVTWNKNKITKLTTGDSSDDAVATGSTISYGTGAYVMANAVDYAANSFYVYQQVYDNNGKPIENTFVDRNGDGVVNANDLYIYKKAAPDVTMGLSSKVIWKDWDFSFTLRASLNNYVYNDVASNLSSLGTSSIYTTSEFLINRPKSALDTNFEGKGTWFLSDYYVQNASFLRCDNITLGYSFKKLFGVLNGRTYATVQNPFVITNYKGLDPEMSGGIDRNLYPRPVTTLVGLSLNF